MASPKQSYPASKHLSLETLRRCGTTSTLGNTLCVQENIPGQRGGNQCSESMGVDSALRLDADSRCPESTGVGLTLEVECRGHRIVLVTSSAIRNALSGK